MTTRAVQVCQELEGLARVAQGIQSRYGAHFALHTAACLNRDKQEMLEHRQSLHVLLDKLLDNAEAIQRANDELIDLARGP